jgi:hypothetical protein
MPAVRGIVQRAARDDYRLSAIVLGIVDSVPMRMRTKVPSVETTQARTNGG